LVAAIANAFWIPLLPAFFIVPVVENSESSVSNVTGGIATVGLNVRL